MIVEVWKRVMDLAKAGTSGMDSEAEFNSKVDSVQKALVELLLQVEEENQQATDAMSWLKKSSGTLTASSSGAITMPNDYLHLDSVAYLSGGNRYSATKLRTNEVEMTRSSPIRKPDLTTQNINYYFKNGQIYVMPEQALAIDLIYYKVPPAATIVLTPSSSDNSDFLTPTVGTDLGWPVSMFNLLVYMILEQFGVEVRENLLVEYSTFGISREMIKTNPQ